jgi:serine/threonine protein kinase
MRFSPGTRLGPYEILAPIGAGGMGEVWKARDTRLDRMVAVKVASERFTDRFEREARAVAALNHPNVCQLYDVGPDYLVMELVEGEPLRGPLPLDKVITYAGQILDALDAAHRKGIVHRDLKPANTLVTKQGVKLLDFGLAKKIETAAVDEATVAEALTSEGQIVGTLQYMAPEQLRGKEADARSDLFSFGCVLYEMLSGKRAFDGPSSVSVMWAVLEQEPAKSASTAPLDHVITGCLAKDPEERFQTARDLKHILMVTAGRAPVSAPASPRLPRERLAWIVTALLVVCLTALSVVHFRERPSAAGQTVRFQIQAPQDATYYQSVSPDGRKLAFIAGDRLWVHSLQSGESRDVAAAAPHVPFWSPDSRFVGYESQGKLKTVDATGGTPRTVAEMQGGLWGCGAWNEEDWIVFGRRQFGLFRVSAQGGVPVQITAPRPSHRDNSQLCAAFLPDRIHFIYFRASADEGKSAIFVGSLNARPDQQSQTPLLATNWQAGYAPPVDSDLGHLIFMREGSLFAQRLDHNALQMKGEPSLIAEQIEGSQGGGYGSFSVSTNGVLVFRQADVNRQVAWIDRSGKLLGVVGDPGEYLTLSLSPDGTRIATVMNRGADAGDLWLLDLNRGGTRTLFSSSPRLETSPVWSPDASQIVFSSNREGRHNLYLKAVTGGGKEDLLLKSEQDKLATHWSSDGRFLLFTELHPKTKSDIWVLPMAGEKKPFPLLITQFNEGQARLSPDGRWIAYVSDESGEEEVYLRSCSPGSTAAALELGDRHSVSNGYGVSPHWRADGRELYFRSRDGRIAAVGVDLKPAVRCSPPKILEVQTSLPPSTLGSAGWESDAKGARFLRVGSKNASRPYTVILNWQAGLKK